MPVGPGSSARSLASPRIRSRAVADEGADVDGVPSYVGSRWPKSELSSAKKSAIAANSTTAAVGLARATSEHCILVRRLNGRCGLRGGGHSAPEPQFRAAH